MNTFLEEDAMEWFIVAFIVLAAALSVGRRVVRALRPPAPRSGVLGHSCGACGPGCGETRQNGDHPDRGVS